MRRTLLIIAASGLLALPALADDKPAPTKPADDKAQTQGKDHRNEQNLDQLLQEAAAAAEHAPSKHESQAAPANPPANSDQAQDANDKAEANTAAPPATKATDKAAPVAEPKKAAAAPAEPAAPPTDDNDTTSEAAAPTALKPVAPTQQRRVHGPYELGVLDCRVLDGAGIERILPKSIIVGEEPDLLCRIIVTQPAAVLAAQHQVTITVTLGSEETFKQTRNVRMSSLGRRALLFVIPASAIASDDPASVKIHAVLSAPATPSMGRDVSFKLETED